MTDHRACDQMDDMTARWGLNSTDAAGDTARLRVMVADDDQDVRHLTRRMVERPGHPVDEAGDGQEAVEALASHRYDLLLLDLSMPRMSGVDVARRLREHPEHRDGMEVAVVSSWDRDERPTPNELGIRVFKPKPLRRHDLAALFSGLGSAS